MFKQFDYEKGHQFRFNRFFAAYVECALWASVNISEENNNDVTFYSEGYEFDDVSDDAIRSMWDDCKSFYDDNITDLEHIDNEQGGTDFWLSRNGHGAGFFDRGLGELGDRLQKAARVWGDSYLYTGNDGKIYVQ